MNFLASLSGALMTLCGSLVGRVLLALGISYVTYKGFDVTIDWLLTSIKGNIGSMPAETVSFLGFLWVDKAIGMVFAAYTAAAAIKVAGGSGVTKMITKAPV